MYRLLALLFFVSVFTGHESLAQPDAGNADYYSSLKWRNIGPARGGRSLGSTGSPGRPNEYYFGATGGGLWKTTDGGNEWFPVTDGQITSSSVGAVAVAETNPDIVFIGTGFPALHYRSPYTHGLPPIQLLMDGLREVHLNGIEKRISDECDSLHLGGLRHVMLAVPKAH